MRLGEELRSEVCVADHAACVEGVAERNRGAIVPAIPYALDRGVLLALKRKGYRPPLERIARKVVKPSLKRRKKTDQPDVSIGVVEDQRDCLLALLGVFCGRL